MKTQVLLCLTLFLIFILPVKSQETDTIDIYDLSLQELMNIEVQVATKTKSTLDESPSIVTVIDRKIIESSGAQTLADIIKMVTGMDYSKASLGWGEPLDEFYGRGVLNTFSQTVLILLNGQNRFNDFTYASPFMSTRINVELIERIEIIRGPGSALYGGNAFAAVINIITRDKGIDKETVLETTASDTPQIGVYFLTKHNILKTDWSFGIQGKYFLDKGKTYDSVQTDKIFNDYETLPQSNKITDGIDPSYDFSMNISAPKNKLNAQIWHTFHKPHPFLTGFFPQPNTYRYQAKQTFLNLDCQPFKNFTFTAYHSIMTWDSRLSLYWEPESTVGTRYSATDLYGTTERNTNSSIGLSYVFDIQNHNFYIGTNFSNDAQSKPTVTYDSLIARQYGYDFSGNAREIVFDERDTGWVSYLPQERNQISIFAQDNWKISQKIAATIGVRYDYFDDLSESNIINPRFALVWNIFSRSKIKIMYGQAFRPPSPSETSIILPPIYGNSNLVAEKIKTGEIAFIQYFSFARFQINGFYSVVKDPIQYISGGVIIDGEAMDTYKNMGKAHMYGSEIELQAKFWFVNYSYVKSEMDRGDGNFVTTPFMARATAFNNLKFLV